MVLPRRARRHEDWAIATIQQLQDEVLFRNVREVLEDFLQHDPVAQVGVREIQPCPFGEAYVQFRHVRDRDRLVRDSPHAFGDVFISFTRHNEGRNWRRVNFNRICWLLIVGIPFDNCNTEDIAAAVTRFAKIISWEKEDALKGKVLVKARVTDLQEIPKSLRWTEGEMFEGESLTSSIEVLMEEMLGGGSPDEDTIPPPGIDPHPIPLNANDFR